MAPSQRTAGPRQRQGAMAISKRTVATLALGATLTIVGVSFGAFPSPALAWDNCPKGLVNDPYPGACRRYVDTNGDSICDLSQSEPAATTTTTSQELSTDSEPAAVTATSGEPPTGGCPLGPCANCGACLGIGSIALATPVEDGGSDEGLVASGTIALAAAAGGATTTSTTVSPSGGANAGSSATAASTIESDTSGQASSFRGYNVSPIALGFFLIYAASFILHRTKKIKVYTHRKIWNVLLLATFLVTGVFGLILTIQLDYALPFSIPIDLLFWHVEAGVAMTLISVFHVGWHLKYYRNLVRSRRRTVRVATAAEGEQSLYDEKMAREARERRRAEREARRGRTVLPGLSSGPAHAPSLVKIARPHLSARGRLEPKPE